MQIYWYGHSCFKLQGKDVSVVLDPYRPGSVPGWKLPPLTADYCLCSHDHGDHSGKGGVALSGRRPALRLEQFSVFHDARQGRDRGKNLISVLTIDGVRIVHLGDLARIALTDEEITRLQGDLNVIAESINKVQEVATDDVEPTANPVPLEAYLRPDVPETPLTQAEATAGAPVSEAGMFVAPRILGQE